MSHAKEAHMSGARFSGLIIFCSDTAKSAAFYEGLLGFTRQSSDQDIELSMPVGDGATASVLLHHGDDPAGHYLGIFEVDDVDATVKQVRAGGFEILREPVDEPWGVRTAGVGAPDGYGLDLITPIPSGPATTQ
jgi:catechol 2,3-dioxygenase-like lactoylglutathione lyase family enzyme